MKNVNSKILEISKPVIKNQIGFNYFKPVPKPNFFFHLSLNWFFQNLSLIFRFLMVDFGKSQKLI